MRIEQVLSNLIGNALKFTQQGEVLVKLELIRKHPKYVSVCFSVQDSGIGIDPEQIPMLFDSFSQADSSTSRRFGGTGLGLSICKGLVDLMGGSIGATSEPGQGSCFSFTIDLGWNPDNETGEFLIPEGLQGKRVLVVDDKVTGREILSTILQDLSLRPTVVESARRCAQELASGASDEPYELVFVGGNVWTADGIKITNGINADNRLSRCKPKIVLLSELGGGVIDSRTPVADVDARVPKPVLRHRVVRAILEVFGHGGLPLTRDRNSSTGGTSKKRRSLVGVKALVVEDNSINQKLAREFLQRDGAEVRVVSNGSDALKALGDRDFHIVLMDIEMPLMDGFEATRRMRADPRLKDIPIVAMTAHAMKGFREKVLAAGMNDYLTKPMDRESFLLTLAKWVGTVPSAQMDRNGPSDATDYRGRQTLKAFPGIDIGFALEEVELDEQTLEDLLLTFGRTFRHSTDDIVKALNAGDFETAGNLVHTVKGASSYIGARDLHEKSVVLETAIGEYQDDRVTDPFDKFKRSLDRVLQSIESLREARSHTMTDRPATPISSTLQDPARMNALIQELLTFLKTHDLKSTEVLQRIKQEPGWEILREEILRGEYCLKTLDFAGARREAEMMRKRLLNSVPGARQ
jgi:two-component system sensor histidine kinase/response regulator